MRLEPEHDVIRAQIAARAIFGAAGLDKAIAALDHQIDAQMQTTLRMAVRTLVERASLADQQPASPDRHWRRSSAVL